MLTRMKMAKNQNGIVVRYKVFLWWPIKVFYEDWAWSNFAKSYPEILVNKFLLHSLFVTAGIIRYFCILFSSRASSEVIAGCSINTVFVWYKASRIVFWNFQFLVWLAKGVFEISAFAIWVCAPSRLSWFCYLFMQSKFTLILICSSKIFIKLKQAMMRKKGVVIVR